MAQRRKVPLEELRRQLQKQRYQVNLEALAEALLERGLLDDLVSWPRRGGGRRR